MACGRRNYFPLFVTGLRGDSSSLVMKTNTENFSAPRLNFRTVPSATLQAMFGLQKAVNESGLEPALLELVKMRASQINGCAFCLDMHYRDARKAGESEQRLYLLSAWRESPGYTARERAALHWTEVLTTVAGKGVSDEDFAEARGQFSEAELAYLTLAIVAINGWNRINVGFRTPPGFVTT